MLHRDLVDHVHRPAARSVRRHRQRAEFRMHRKAQPDPLVFHQRAQPRQRHRPGDPRALVEPQDRPIPIAAERPDPCTGHVAGDLEIHLAALRTQPVALVQQPLGVVEIATLVLEPKSSSARHACTMTGM